jgi:hypothetical protein
MSNTNKHSNGITANISGLKCDGPACDYHDPTIKLEDYEAHINAPCPKCGAPLLTQADYDQVQQILSLVATINDMPSVSEPTQEAATIELGLNGTGDVAILSIHPTDNGGNNDGEN